MKSLMIVALALVCVLGLTSAMYDGYGYGYGYPTQSAGGLGNGGLLMLIGLLFVLMTLFSTNNRTASPAITIVNATG